VKTIRQRIGLYLIALLGAAAALLSPSFDRGNSLFPEFIDYICNASDMILIVRNHDRDTAFRGQ
jgi:hypothetical protein